MKLDSMRARMTAGFTLFIALLMLVVGVLLLWSARRNAERQTSALLAATVVDVRQYAAVNAPFARLTEIADAQNGERGGGEVGLWVLSPTNKVLWRSRPPAWRRFGRPPGFNSGAPADMPPDAPPPREPPPPPRFSIPGFGGPPRDGRGGRGGPGRGNFNPDPQFVPPLHDPAGWRVAQVKWGENSVLIGVPWHKEEHVLRDQMVSLIVLALCVVGATALGAWFLVGRTLSPLSNLAQQARETAQNSTQHKSLEPLVLNAPSRDREMRELVDMLNELLSSVFQAARSKEQFHTAASHELRTPLQALSGHLQVALSRERSAPEYRAALDEAAIQTDRLTELVRDLLMLNQLQMATSRPGGEAINIAETCDLALSQLEKAIAAAGLQVDEKLADADIAAPMMQVSMLLRNLIENALKYARPGSTVRIETSANPATFSIWNESATDEPMQPEKWFEPFFRPDESRTGTTGGNGLGLAICKAICDANGWTISLTNEESGIRATVHFETTTDSPSSDS
jgi:signal transduction histidine kinase